MMPAPSTYFVRLAGLGCGALSAARMLVIACAALLPPSILHRPCTRSHHTHTLSTQTQPIMSVDKRFSVQATARFTVLEVPGGTYNESCPVPSSLPPFASPPRPPASFLWFAFTQPLPTDVLQMARRGRAASACIYTHAISSNPLPSSFSSAHAPSPLPYPPQSRKKPRPPPLPPPPPPRSPTAAANRLPVPQQLHHP